VLLLAIGSSATAEAAPLRECGDLRVSFGVSIIDVTNITTRSVGCSRARRFSRAFAKQGVTFACQEGPYCFFRAELTAFPAPLQPVQTSDQAATETAMGRGAVAITLTPSSGEAVQFLTAHLKSKLLTFPGGRFQPTDEDERARFGAYALSRRTAEATTLRVWATSALADEGTTRRATPPPTTRRSQTSPQPEQLPRSPTNVNANSYTTSWDLTLSAWHTLQAPTDHRPSQELDR